EILTLQWRQVNFKTGEVRLDPGQTKNREPRVFPFRMLPELAACLERQREYTSRVEKRLGAIITHVFHREDGSKVSDIRKPWRKACKAAGLVGRIPHDFRRTAVRNLERAGVPRSVAMKLVGHKTPAIYSR